MGMGLNFGLQRIPSNVITAPQTNINSYDSLLGLTPSNYTGLKSVGNTGYFYGNNRMYQPYTPSSQSSGIGSFGGVSVRPEGGSSPFPAGFGRGTSESKPSYESIIVNGQEFRTVSPDITGFRKTALNEDKYAKDSVYKYSPSMAYIYSQMRPQATPQSTMNVPGYQPATSQMLSSPVSTGAGASRFLNTGNLLGFNFTPAQTATTTSNP